MIPRERLATDPPFGEEVTAQPDQQPDVAAIPAHAEQTCAVLLVASSRVPVNHPEHEAIIVDPVEVAHVGLGKPNNLARWLLFQQVDREQRDPGPAACGGKREPATRGGQPGLIDIGVTKESLGRQRVRRCNGRN